VLLQLGAPGVPDFYQGTELWDFSLVDPDNRRPVDFDRRARWLAELDLRAARDRLALATELWRDWPDGRVKLYLTHEGLAFRHAHADLFAHGEYHPLAVTGPRAAHVCAFARHRGDDWALVVTPRLTARLAASAGRLTPAPPSRSATDDLLADLPPLQAPLGPAVWGETHLRLPARAPRRWRNVFTGQVISAVGDGTGAAALPLGHVLAGFPQALLTPDRD
jgi:(1->4)-alpha-D-glucan 1-alpha-D-glucosylmutase